MMLCCGFERKVGGRCSSPAAFPLLGGGGRGGKLAQASPEPCPPPGCCTPSCAHLLHVDGDVQLLQDVPDGARREDQACTEQRSAGEAGGMTHSSSSSRNSSSTSSGNNPTTAAAAAAALQGRGRQRTWVHGAAHHAAQRVPRERVKEVPRLIEALRVWSMMIKECRRLVPTGKAHRAGRQAGCKQHTTDGTAAGPAATAQHHHHPPSPTGSGSRDS